MKTFTLLLLSVLVAPALALSGFGAMRYSWRTVLLGAAVVAVAAVGIPMTLVT